MNRDLKHTGQDTVREPGALGFPMAFKLLVSTLNLPRAPIAGAGTLGSNLHAATLSFSHVAQTAWPASMQSLTEQDSGGADLLEHVKVTLSKLEFDSCMVEVRPFTTFSSLCGSQRPEAPIKAHACAARH